VSDLPRPMRLVAEHLEEYSNLRSKSALPESIIELEGQLFATCEEVVRLAEPFDMFGVVGTIARIEMSSDPESYQETEHEGQVAAIELLCELISTRGRRHGSKTDYSDFPEAIEAIHTLLHDATRLGSLLIMLKTSRRYGREGDLSIGPLLRQVFLRNVAFPHMLRDTLDGLFASARLADDCRSAMGCTYSDITTAFEAIEKILAGGEAGWREGIQRAIEKALEVNLEGKEVDLDSLREGINRAFDPISGALLTVESIAHNSGLTRSVVEAVLTAFSRPIKEAELGVAVDWFFSGASDLGRQPLIFDGDDAYLLPHRALLLPSIRGGIEDHLKRAELWTGYSDRRGEYLEEASLGYLQKVLPTADVLAGTKYFVPNRDRLAVETKPDQFTDLGETDGLVLVDDVALIVEAKSASLSPIARTGNLNRVKADVRKIVSSASKQASRLRDRIDADGGIRLRDNTWLDLSHVREIHSITVSLEDLSGYATLTSALFDAGLLDDIRVPWTVGLHDLRIICDLCDRPAELLLYIRRRTAPDVTRWFLTLDELDYFMYFFTTGLFVEPDPEVRFELLPQLGPPTTAERRRHSQMTVSMLLSQTDPLDAWYLYEIGERQTPAAKPSLNAEPDILKLVDSMEMIASPGWLRVGATLLAGSGKLQKQLARYPTELARLVAKDNSTHTNTIIGGATTGDSFVIVWAVAPRGMPLTNYVRHLNRYVKAKKHQLQVAIGAALVFRSDDLSVPASLLYDNRRPGPDNDLDRAVDELGLKAFGSGRDDLLRTHRNGH